MRRALAIACALIASLSCASPGAAPRVREAFVASDAPMPTPGRARGARAVRDDAACEACHEEASASWRTSMHHLSSSNAAYRASLAIEPLPFCRACHAPEADPESDAPSAASDLGVGCVTCHVTREGEVLAAPGASRQPSPHSVRRVASFATDAACEACHEFDFPAVRGAPPPERMQATVSEHRASTASSEPCAACHMRRAGSRERSHAFPASRDAALVMSALGVTARRLAPGRVELTLTPSRLGHAFPTGDLFRRIALEAEVPDGGATLRARRYLARRFTAPRDGDPRRLASDDRLSGSEPARVTLDVGSGAEGRVIVWRVTYERVAHPVGGDESDASIEGAIEIARGEVAP